MRRLGAGALAALMAGAGCGYTSEYVPPQDGRARVVYRNTDAFIELSGATRSDACVEEIEEALGQRPRRRLVHAPGEGAAVAGGYWAPVYYGPRIVVVSPGVPPLLPQPPLFSPSLALAKAATSGALKLTAPHLGGGGGGHGSGGNGGDALAYLAVLLLIVLPPIDVALAIATPESSTVSSSAIDRVNVYNDLARTPGTACSGPPPWGTGEPPPPPPPPVAPPPPSQGGAQ